MSQAGAVGNAVRMVRPQRLAEDIVFVDGLSRSGKALIAPVLSSFERSELWRLDHNFEYLCILDHLKQIDRRAAAMMVQLESDLELYSLMVGRNCNFRPTDDSGADMNLLGDRYRQRLGEPDGDRVKRLIQETRPILNIVIHWILPMSEVLWDALGDRLRLFVVAVRSPIWQIRKVFDGRWDTRVGVDPRDFQPCYVRNGELLPWYAADWDDAYPHLTPLERAIQQVASYIEGCERFVAKLRDEQRQRVFFIPFERFSADPRPFVVELASRLGTRVTPLTESILKHLNLPRAETPAAIQTEHAEFDKLLQSESVSPSYKSLVRTLCDDYEARYLSHLSSKG